jgi:predicted enzyme involved in methoxymalonyl-ACP biosynthesis
VFGNSGVAGMAVFRLADAQHAELDTFLMSCRVIGREAEAAFLHALLRHLAAQGVVEVVADFLPTKKNDLSKTFLADQGFALRDDGRYIWPLRDKAPQPESAFKIQMTVEI